MIKKSLENEDYESTESLARLIPNTMTASPSRLFSREMTMTTLAQSHTMWIFTWNLAGKMLTKEFDISQVIDACNLGQPPDIILFGFQEIVPLNFF